MRMRAMLGLTFALPRLSRSNRCRSALSVAALPSRFRADAWGLCSRAAALAAKQGITLSNSVGVIDSGYRGEVCAALINQSYETVTLEAGTRVCQLVVMPYVPCELVPVDELSDTERGAGGFGSTGVE